MDEMGIAAYKTVIHILRAPNPRRPPRTVWDAGAGGAATPPASTLR